jgi:hypothetical protein
VAPNKLGNEMKGSKLGERKKALKLVEATFLQELRIKVSSFKI